MNTMNISLPKNLKEYIEERVKTGGYGNISEYVRELIRQDQKRRVDDRLEALLLEGLRSGYAAIDSNVFEPFRQSWNASADTSACSMP